MFNDALLLIAQIKVLPAALASRNVLWLTVRSFFVNEFNINLVDYSFELHVSVDVNL